MSKVIQFTNVNIGLHTYTPEMGQLKPIANLEARMSHDGKHYYIDTMLTLKESRSVKLLKVYTPNDFVKPDHYKIGWNEYKVTANAFEQLKKQYSISCESLLD
jgi:hypothetical protein